MIDFDGSETAIRNYMNAEPQNKRVHYARVCVLKDGEIEYESTLEVYANIEHNASYVIITGDSNFDSRYYPRYSNEFQLFSLRNSTLVIDCKDMKGNPIQIHITSM